MSHSIYEIFPRSGGVNFLENNLNNFLTFLFDHQFDFRAVGIHIVSDFPFDVVYAHVCDDFENHREILNVISKIFKETF